MTEVKRRLRCAVYGRACQEQQRRPERIPLSAFFSSGHPKNKEALHPENARINPNPLSDFQFAILPL
ncbi:MAG: hypothetical protein V1721_07405 [Pseudomonadota bacterium]